MKPPAATVPGDSIPQLLQTISKTTETEELTQQLGSAYFNHGNWKAAALWYDRCLSHNPQNRIGLVNGSACHFELGAYSAAIALLDQALVYLPDDPKLLHNRGYAAEKLNRLAEARDWYDRLLHLHPDYHDGYVQRGYLQLRMGDYQAGFADLEWRIHTAPPNMLKLKFPFWNGQPAPESTILVHGEQGFGDNFFSMRFWPLLQGKAGRFIYWCHLALLPVFQALQPALHGEIRSQADRKIRIDYQLPLMSLPHRLGVSSSLIQSLPGFSLKPETRPAWVSAFLAEQNRTHIGISWRGKTNQVPLDVLTPLIQRFPDLDWISVQHAPTPDERTWMADMGIRDSSEELLDFGHTAYLLAELNYLITLDSVLANLAGFLGHPAAVLLPWCSEWRWGMDPDNSIWFPESRLCRQARPGDWSYPVQKLMTLCERFPKV